MELTFLSKEITSLEEISQILQTFRRPTRDELDKKAFKTLLSGFQVIVKSLENDTNNVDLEDAVDWLRLYFKARMVVLNSDIKLLNFSKTVPIAITYIIGWLQHAPDNNTNFFSEVLNIAYKLVCMTDPSFLKKLEEYGQGVILLLWQVIDKVGQYNTQFQALQLFITILNSLDKDFVYWEVRNLPYVNSEEIIYKILELLRVRPDEGLFKKLARSILNQHNNQKNLDAHVHSFYCKTLEIGNNFKFIKGTYADRFWFDINKHPHTLSFEGRISPKYSRKYQNVNVSINIREMFIDKNNLYVKFLPPAKILGAKIDDEEIFKEDLACMSLIKTELTRFVNYFGVSLKKQIELNSIKKSSKLIFNTSNNREEETLRPIKASVQIVPTIDLSSESLFNKNNNKYLSCNFPKRTNFFEQNDISDFSNQNISPDIEHRNQFQCFSNKLTKTQNQQATVMLDEYEDINVSDAEPCQSYRNFQTRKSNTDNENSPLMKFKTIKRFRKSIKTQNNCQKLCEAQKGINTAESHNLEKIPKISTSKKSSLLMNEFDQLKNGSSIKTVCVYRGRTDGSKSNDFVYNTSKKTTIENVFDLTMDCDETQSNLINPRTPERSQHVVDLTSISSLKEPVTSFDSLECNQALITHEKQPEDCLVYHKRSENDSSSDDSNTRTWNTPKRTHINAHKRSAKKRLFGLDHTSTSDSDTDYNVTEFIYVGKKDFRTNMCILNTTISSMFKKHSTFPKHRKIRVLTDIQDVVELEK